jgi:hypothetical protein
VLLLTDWLAGDHQLLVQGIYRVTGPRIPTVGGAASDSGQFGPTFVFHDDAILEQGAVAVWIASDKPLPVATRHGWQPMGMPLLVSRAEGTEVLEFGGRPAAAVFQEQLGFAPDDLNTVEEFRAQVMAHPLGVLTPDGSLHVRAVIAKTPHGALQTIAQVPAGCAVQVTTGTPDSLLDVVPPVAEDLLARNPEPGVVLAFSCVGRGWVCGERILDEPGLLQNALGDVPSFGFYTYGEFSRTRGVLGTHTATLTALAL